MDLSLDIITYLGKLADWLKICPDGKVEYGEYYPDRMSVKFDGDVIGEFINEDPEWVFRPDPKYWGLTN